MEGSSTVFDLKAKGLDGRDVDLSTFRGKTLLVVNTASKCGFTPQYGGLEALHRKYADRGLVILAFPCDQFAHQEPGGAEEIAAFCTRNHGVTFPLMEKTEVNGPGAHPVFRFLKGKAPGAVGEGIKWNFTKFLVSRDGLTVKRFAPATAPAKLEEDIERVLGNEQA
jgi:glutathione peroxidase